MANTKTTTAKKKTTPKAKSQARWGSMGKAVPVDVNKIQWENKSGKFK